MPMFRGRPACHCLVRWLPRFEAELKRRGIITHSIDIAQLNGNAEASAGTHKGGAADIWQHDPETIKVAREMGAAAWARTKAQGFDPHTHLVLNGCPHNSAARYQIIALAEGFNGLGTGGRGGRDDGPLPRRLRTWRAGIAWAKAQRGSKRYAALAKAHALLRVARKTALRQRDSADASLIADQMKRMQQLDRKARRR